MSMGESIEPLLVPAMPLVEWLSLERQVYAQWCSIGDLLSLSSHSQIAKVLLDCYQRDTESKCKFCTVCGCLLAWLCPHCVSASPEPLPTTQEPIKLESTNLPLQSLSDQPDVQQQTLQSVQQQSAPNRQTATKQQSVTKHQSMTKQWSVTNQQSAIYQHSMTYQQSVYDSEQQEGQSSSSSAAEIEDAVCSDLNASVENIADQDSRSHVCTDCGKPFAFAYLLRRHQVVHTKHRNHVCDICSKRFRFVDGLRRHKKLLHGSGEENRKTDKRERKKEKRNARKEKHGRRPKHRSPTPELEAVDVDNSDGLNATALDTSLNGWSRRLSTRRKESADSYTKSGRKEKERESQLTVQSTGLKSHRCDICGKTFPFLSLMKKHQVVHDTTLGPTHACDVCHKTFKYRESMKKHRQGHFSDGLQKCNICSRTFSRPGSLQQHIAVVHRRVECEVCHKTFCSASYLKQHKLTHTGQRPSHVCHVCGKAFQLVSTLKTHLQLHTQPNRFVCSICDKGFTQAGNLKLHMVFHSQKKSHMCDQCGKSFYTSGHLVRHRRLHTGEKPHRCEICNAAFADISNLHQHKARHTQDKPFQCPVCQRAFPLKNDMQQHRKSHLGIKPHVCSVCNMSFTRASNLRHHRKSHAALTTAPAIPSTVAGAGLVSPGPGVGVSHDKSLEINARLDVTAVPNLAQRELVVSTPGMSLAADGKALTCHLCWAYFDTEDQLRIHKFTHYYSMTE